MSNDDVLAAQIKSSIITKIKTQEYLPGELLPSERDFATMYSVSRYLIHDIFDELISQHYLIRVHGKGTFVRKPEQNRVALGVLNESKNASFTSLVRNFGIEISNKCLGTGIIKNRKILFDITTFSLHKRCFFKYTVFSEKILCTTSLCLIPNTTIGIIAAISKSMWLMYVNLKIKANGIIPAISIILPKTSPDHSL